MANRIILGAPPLAKLYNGEREKLDQLHSQLLSLMAYSEIVPHWTITTEQFSPHAVEWSRDPHMSFFADPHPAIDRVTYLEGVWIRQYYSLPIAVIIYLPYSTDYLNDPLLLTISDPPASWISEMVKRYSSVIASQVEGVLVF